MTPALRKLCELPPPAGAYPWQREGWQMYQRAMAAAREGKRYDVLIKWARQLGKNQLAAAWDRAFLLVGGLAASLGEVRTPWEAVHSAPTYEPGVSVHKRRLEGMLAELGPRNGPWSCPGGRFFQCNGLGAQLHLVSAGQTAQRRGLTASAYQRLDEVQMTLPEVFRRELEPMTASTRAPRFYHGTEWLEDSLMAQLTRELQALQDADGIQRISRVPWQVAAEHLPEYGEHVEDVIAALGGADHPFVQSEYSLETPEAVGLFLRPAERDLLFGGQHPAEAAPRVSAVRVAGVDFCGAAEEPDEHALDPEWTSKRDNTCVRIGRLAWGKLKSGLAVPVILVEATLLLPGQPPESTVRKVEQFLRLWRVQAVVGDGRGVGDGPSATLEARLRGTWTTLKSGSADVTRMGYRLLGAIRAGRFRLWRQEGVDPVLEESRRQYRHLRKEVKDGGRFVWGHPKRKVDGQAVHDDICKADGYMLEAAYYHLSRKNPAAAKLLLPTFDDAAGTAG